MMRSTTCNPTLLGQADDGAPRDAVEEAVRRRRVQHAVLDEEDVGARAFGDAAAPVEHQGVGIAHALGAVLLQRADHVEPGGLGLGRRGRGVGPAILGDRQPDALEALLHGEVGAPIPGGDGQMDLGRLRRDAHHLAAAPGDRPHVAIGELVGLDRVAAGLVDLGHAVGDGEVHRLGALVEALAVLGQLEDLAAVGPLPLEHRAGVVQPMAQHVQVGLAPGHELAVEPDEPIAVVVGDHVGHALSPPGSKPGLDGGLARRPRRPLTSRQAANCPICGLLQAPQTLRRPAPEPLKSLASTNNRGQISQHG